MDDRLRLLLILIPALPLASAVLTPVLGPRLLRRQSHWPTLLAFAAACVCSLMLLWQVKQAQEAGLPEPGMPASAGQEAGGPGAGVPGGGFEYVVRLWTWADVDGAYLQPRVPPSDSTLSVVDGGWRNFRIDVVLRADALTCTMLAMVTFVSTLVALFAVGYMHGDRGYWRFFTYISLFVFSMTMLVSVSNFILLFVFWEAVGVCSYLLIGFWYQRPEAAAAGKKAFLVNRVGDFGFALALFLIWTTYGTLNYHDALPTGETDPARIAAAVEAVSLSGDADTPASSGVVRGVLGKMRIAARDYRSGGVALAICLLLLLGACGKSAQFPLHVWLPDAMEGPTPVSALIHAATMVTAGVYMVARCTPLFMASPEAQLAVAGIGTFTALLAALIALTQYDLKRVLAYSTVSQLGYMFLGLGAGTFAGITSGMFHLFTHAFFKALLFLGAGSVMHAMGNVIDMRRFGGLRRLLPTTYATFLCGCLALAGLPFFSGFWSKDGILAAVESKAHDLRHASHGPHAGPGHASHTPTLGDGGMPVRDGYVAAIANAQQPPGGLSDAQRIQHATIYEWLYYGGLLTAFLTAFYTFRAFLMTFHGEERIPHEAGHHAHESPPVMTVPLIILAVFALLAGGLLDRSYLHPPHHVFADFLGHTPSLAAGAVAETRVPFEAHLFVAGVSSLIALAGTGLALFLYLGDQQEVRWIQRVLDLEGADRIPDVLTRARVRQQPWLVKLSRGASAVGLGWLLSFFGGLLQLLVYVLTAPLTLGNYLSPYKWSQHKFFVDELYELVIVLPLKVGAQLSFAVDRWLIDGTVNLFGRIPVWTGSLMRSLQMGLLQFYALATVLGVLILLAAKLIWT